MARKKPFKVKVTVETEVVVSASSELAACREAEKVVERAMLHGSEYDLSPRLTSELL